MAISDIGVQNRAAAAPLLSKQEFITQALEILNAPHQGELSRKEIIQRVSAVRDLAQVEVPFEERRELDDALMRMAIREPHASNEARAIIRQIFKALAPISGPNFPQRDAQGRIIPRIRPELPLPTDEDVARWDAEYEAEQVEC